MNYQESHNSKIVQLKYKKFIRNDQKTSHNSKIVQLKYFPLRKYLSHRYRHNSKIVQLK